MLSQFDVQLSLKDESIGDSLSEDFYSTCSFCKKHVKTTHANRRTYSNLAKNLFFCPFCLRHNMYQPSSRNILVMSYRAIIGYYYIEKYLEPRNRIWLCEIREMISNHQQTGLQNPAFNYDEETFLWFVNFNRQETPLEEVLDVVSDMLNCFDITKNFGQPKHDAMSEKFAKAIDRFYKERQRPDGKEFLIPTFSGLLRSDYMEQTRLFTLEKLVNV